IVYPQGVPNFWDLLCGRVREIVVHVRAVSIPEDLASGSYEADAAYRRQLNDWVQAMWREKDDWIGALHSARRKVYSAECTGAAFPAAHQYMLVYIIHIMRINNHKRPRLANTQSC